MMNAAALRFLGPTARSYSRALSSSSRSSPHVSTAAAVLGVSTQASEAEVQAAFKRQAKATHPDSRSGSSAHHASTMLDKLVGARKVLLSNIKLAPALESLSGASTAASTSAPSPPQDDPGDRRPAAIRAVQEKYGVKPVNLKKGLNQRRYLEADGTLDVVGETMVQRRKRTTSDRMAMAADALAEATVDKAERSMRAHEARRAGSVLPVSEPGGEPVTDPHSRQARMKHDKMKRGAGGAAISYAVTAERLVDEQMRDFHLEDSPLRGKPIKNQVLEASPLLDQFSWRANNILKNSGCKPRWVELDGDIRAGAKAIRERIDGHLAGLLSNDSLADPEAFAAQAPALLSSLHGNDPYLNEALSGLNRLIRDYNLNVPNYTLGKGQFSLEFLFEFQATTHAKDGFASLFHTAAGQSTPGRRRAMEGPISSLPAEVRRAGRVVATSAAGQESAEARALLYAQDSSKRASASAARSQGGSAAMNAAPTSTASFLDRVWSGFGI